MIDLPELLIPAGTLGKLDVALAYGADAVYVGAAGFSMRPDDASFSTRDLRTAVERVHYHKKKIYVGVNSLVLPHDMDPLQRWLRETKDIDFDAIILADPATLMLVKEQRPDVEIHISTQMSVANALAAKFWRQQGASRVILARECSLAEVKDIAEQSDVPVEIFVHGAMCVAVSGRCLLSAYMTGYNASRGECKHSCRWQWRLAEAKRPGEEYPVIETGNKTVFLSSTDLCLIEHIPQVVQTGAAALKVEGRMKSEFYVAAVTRAYRAALDAYAQDPENYHFDPAWLAEVHTVRHHPYATGFAFGYPTENPEQLQAQYIDIGTHEFVGIVESVNHGYLIVHVKHPFRYDETLEWIGPGYTGGKAVIESILDPAGEPANRAHPGTRVRIKLEEEQKLPPLAILRRKRDRDTQAIRYE